MQMALDLETTNNTYFKGYAYWKPVGFIGGVLYRNPFEEWPEEVKQYWTYDPEGETTKIQPYLAFQTPFV